MDLNTMIANENLFKLQCLIKTTEIQHSVQCKLGRKLFLALATNNSDIILYLKRESSCLPVIKRIPWFQAPHKKIAAFCFDPWGAWLLCVTLDSSLYIIPALALVGESQATDKKWRTDDVTYIPFMTSQFSHFRYLSHTNNKINFIYLLSLIHYYYRKTGFTVIYTFMISGQLLLHGGKI